MTIIKSNTQTAPAPWTRWWFAGPSGSGKTMAAGTFPNPLFIEPKNEASSTTLIENGISADVWKIESMADMEECISDLVSSHDAMQRGNEKAFPWETVVIESLTHYSDYIVEALTNHHEKGMEQRMWGQFSAHLTYLHNRLANLDAHVVYTSLVDYKDQTTELIPMVQGRSSKILPSAVNSRGFCDARMRQTKDGPVTDYKVYFRPHKNFDARSRYQWVPSVVTNFNFVELYNSAFGDNNDMEKNR